MQAISSTPKVESAILLAHVLRVERAWLLAHRERVIGRAAYDEFRKLVEERATGVPVAYLTGSVGFYKHEFKVTRDVLIPRPETEHIVDAAIEHARTLVLRGARQVRAFEAGVGSGAIACSLAAAVPQVTVDGTDVSDRALEVARSNAERIGVSARCRFMQADVVPNDLDQTYDLILANLPYIPTHDLPHHPDPVAYEPAVALDGGLDGVGAYRKLLGLAPALTAPEGLLLLEAAPPVMETLRRLAEAAYPGADLQVRRDYAGLERVLSVRIGPPPGSARHESVP